MDPIVEKHEAKTNNVLSCCLFTIDILICQAKVSQEVVDLEATITILLEVHVMQTIGALSTKLTQ
mgnify:CR=1 FL=1